MLITFSDTTWPALALDVSVLVGSVVLVLLALHAYASWTIRNIDGDGRGGVSR